MGGKKAFPGSFFRVTQPTQELAAKIFWLLTLTLFHTGVKFQAHT